MHDVINQHMRAINTMSNNSLDTFVTSVIELKLYQTSMFAWQDYTHDQREVPPYTTLLEFLDRRAQATENTIHECEQRCSTTNPAERIFPKPLYTISVDETCIACKSAKHPLYRCRMFKGFSHGKKLQLGRENGICLNFLKPGHFGSRCPSTQKCKKCLKPHLPWFHIHVDQMYSSIFTDANCKESIESEFHTLS